MKRYLKTVTAIAVAAFLASCTLNTAATVTGTDTSSPETTVTDIITSTQDTATSDITSDIPTQTQGTEVTDPTEPISVDKSFPSVYISYDAEETLHVSYYINAPITVTSGDFLFAGFTDPNAQVRIRGNSTSSGAKKPLNIKFSKSIELFGLGKAKKWCLLANMYDKSLMRNKLALDFAREIGLVNSSNAQYVNVYINNEYAGNYLLCESIGVGKTRVDIDQSANEFLLELEPYEGYNNELFVKTDIYNLVFGLDDTDSVTEEQTEYLTSFLNGFEYALKFGTFDDFSEYIDVDSFVNLYIVNELFKNVDFSTSSTRFYIKSGKLYAGPVWDFDLSAGNCSEKYYPTYNNAGTDLSSAEGIWCSEFWFADMMNCVEFSALVSERYAELQPQITNLTDDNDLGTNKIDELIQKNASSFASNFEVWNIFSVDSILEWQEPFPSFEQSVEFLRTWLRARNEYLLSVLCPAEDN